jgi:hypothetical protein
MRGTEYPHHDKINDDIFITEFLLKIHTGCYQIRRKKLQLFE